MDSYRLSTVVPAQVQQCACHVHILKDALSMPHFDVNLVSRSARCEDEEDIHIGLKDLTVWMGFYVSIAAKKIEACFWSRFYSVVVWNQRLLWIFTYSFGIARMVTATDGVSINYLVSTRYIIFLGLQVR